MVVARATATNLNYDGHGVTMPLAGTLPLKRQEEPEAHRLKACRWRRKPIIVNKKLYTASVTTISPPGPSVKHRLMFLFSRRRMPLDAKLIANGARAHIDGRS